MLKIISKIKFFNFIFLTFFFILHSTIFSENLKNSPELITGTLNNNIKYYILKNQYPKNKASLNLIVNSGSLEESDSEEGVAHFIEHMAFNGTALYPKNELISFLQSIGLKFGDDLNAYTTYDETAYILDIPTNDDKTINIAMDVLKEWAFNITLNEKDVQSEKNIIVEEWRTKQGIKNRISTLKRNSLFSDSVFAKRLPIGTFNSINNINSEILKKYYDKFYTPNRMSIIAVGDFDPLQLEAIIKDKFFTQKKYPQAEKPQFKIPNTSEQTMIFSDKEITTSTLSISKIKNLSIENTEKGVKENLTQLLYCNVLNNRFSILKKKENSFFNEGQIFSYPLNKDNEVIELAVSIKEDNILEGYEEILNLISSLAFYPPHINELENEKNEILSSLKLEVNNKDSIDNSLFVEEIKDVFLLDSVFLNPTDKYILLEKLLKEISVYDILEYSKNFAKSNKVTLLTLPQKENLNNITKDKILSIQEKIKNTTPLNFNFFSNKELETKKLPPGKILKRVVLNPGTKFETLNYKLSNGINVIYKKTDFEKDKIYMNFFKEENSSNYSKSKYYNSIFTPYMLINSGVGNLTPEEYEQFKKGKNFSITPYLRDYTQGFEIISDFENLGTSLTVLNSIITDKKFDDIILKNLLDKNKEKIINQDNSPIFNFSRTITSSLFKEHYRRQPLTLDNLSSVNKNEILNLYKNKFSNFYGYNLIVVGSIPQEKLEEFLINNFASLNSKKIESKVTPLNIILENNKTEKTVVQGEDEKSRVAVIYPYKGVYSNKNRVLYNSLSQLLDILLIDKIRENSAQVYSIYSDASLEYYNYNENYLSINFTTNHKNVNEVIKNLKTVLKEVSEGEFDKKKIDDIITNYTINYETELNKNSFWYSYLYKNTLLKNRDYHLVPPQELKEILTMDALKDFISNSIDQDNYIQVILKPEKFEAN
ncbi:MAG: insulinase family protein [Fusobacteriaceae bacterium]|nr:insulinase family protein [Fusobacteriaceae bacterium]MBP9509599.1 insulinase family protein [Fusobacteriaceae bacterium]